MSKKRTGLDTLVVQEPETGHQEEDTAQSSSVGVDVESKKEEKRVQSAKSERKGREDIKQQAVYLQEPVYEQLRKLAFEERKKMHDYYLEGLERVFKNRGLKSIAELTKKQ